jgi:hypothetical protein
LQHKTQSPTDHYVHMLFYDFSVGPLKIVPVCIGPHLVATIFVIPLRKMIRPSRHLCKYVNFFFGHEGYIRGRVIPYGRWGKRIPLAK